MTENILIVAQLQMAPYNYAKTDDCLNLEGLSLTRLELSHDNEISTPLCSATCRP